MSLIRSTICGLIAVVTAPAAGQSVSGRATDGTGAPVARVRILAYPVGDSTEAATRVAFTNAQGDFTLRLTEGRSYVVRARRVGFAPERDQVVDLTHVRDARIVITLRALRVALAPVRVVAGTPRCLDIDDPAQSRLVRDWLDHGLAQIQARRILERDFTYRIDVQRTRVPAPRTPPRPLSYMHGTDGAVDHVREDAFANLAGVARAVLANVDGVMPGEATLLLTFRSSYCFLNIPAQDSAGHWTLHFHNKSEAAQVAGQPGIAGSLTFTDDGLAIERAEFRFSAGGKEAGSAYLEFATVAIEGEMFPLLRSRGVSRVAKAPSVRASSLVERFEYSVFRRVR